jgi:adenosine deaminase
MLAGMEVTIGTDNRYLHAEDASTLTSEYLMAARLAGGLTRWEVLQIVKAGFKNAFLDKSEVRELIGAAESLIRNYRH